jgi:hypothetical protein
MHTCFDNVIKSPKCSFIDNHVQLSERKRVAGACTSLSEEIRVEITYLLLAQDYSRPAKQLFYDASENKGGRSYEERRQSNRF